MRDGQTPRRRFLKTVSVFAATGFAGWIRLGNREPYAFLGTIIGAVVSLGYTI
jgi:hypothetical protein